METVAPSVSSAPTENNVNLYDLKSNDDHLVNSSNLQDHLTNELKISEKKIESKHLENESYEQKNDLKRFDKQVELKLLKKNSDEKLEEERKHKGLASGQVPILQVLAPSEKYKKSAGNISAVSSLSKPAMAVKTLEKDEKNHSLQVVVKKVPTPKKIMGKKDSDSFKQIKIEKSNKGELQNKINEKQLNKSESPKAIDQVLELNKAELEKQKHSSMDREKADLLSVGGDKTLIHPSQVHLQPSMQDLTLQAGKDHKSSDAFLQAKPMAFQTSSLFTPSAPQESKQSTHSSSMVYHFDRSGQNDFVRVSLSSTDAGKVVSLTASNPALQNELSNNRDSLPSFAEVRIEASDDSLQEDKQRSRHPQDKEEELA